MQAKEAAATIAIFCDYENVAIGAKQAAYGDFQVGPVLERLLDKGNIVVKKAYSDWERYKSARRDLHEGGFELIEIPHVSYSGKNSADIRLVVDALDLSYTKPHVDTFVIVSGDSDFSPLVQKLRENAKRVICVGVKASTSDMLIESSDEFIYYDDLMREMKREPQKGGDKKEEALNLVLKTVDRLLRDREGNVWSSMVKQALKRKRPNFSETYHGYRNFNQLLEDARDRGLLELAEDEKGGGYIVLGLGPKAD